MTPFVTSGIFFLKIFQLNSSRAVIAPFDYTAKVFQKILIIFLHNEKKCADKHTRFLDLFLVFCFDLANLFCLHLYYTAQVQQIRNLVVSIFIFFVLVSFTFRSCSVLIGLIWPFSTPLRTCLHINFFLFVIFIICHKNDTYDK